MSEFKGTPGPWYLSVSDDETKAYIQESKENNRRHPHFATIRADPRWGNGEGEANAHLIAAAPDLLEELIRAANDLDSLGYNVSSARAAIAKALGETK